MKSNENLTILLDLSSQFWMENKPEQVKGSLITELISHVEIALNSFLCFNSQNTVQLYIYDSYQSQLIFPQNKKDELMIKSLQFEIINKQIVQRIQQFLSAKEADIYNSKISTTLTQALCYINMLQKNEQNTKIHYRILIISCTGVSDLEYINFINCVFTAHQKSVKLDAFAFPKGSIYLTQACYITGGLYFNPKVDYFNGLIQYFFQGYLVDNISRDLLIFPEAHSIDFASSCVCCQTKKNKGFICSVCLAFYCNEQKTNYESMCKICKTRYDILQEVEINL